MPDDNVIELRPAQPAKTVIPSRSPEHIERMHARRRELIAAGDERAKGGRPRKRLRREELEALAVKTAGEMLYEHRARAVKVLVAALDSKDEGKRVNAALKLLEYTDGKPTQRIEQTTDSVTEVVYRTAALGELAPLPVADAG